MRLEGKTAIVSGGASGIGLATVERFVQEGAKVVCLDIEGSNSLTSLAESGEVVFVKGSVASDGDWHHAFDTAIDFGGRVDILFNNAGFGISGSVEDVDTAQWDAVFAVKVRGTFLGSRFAVAQMRKQGAGAIVNNASIMGQIGQPRLAAYSSSKAAVIGLTRQTAIDYARFNIRCNCVCPGLTLTANIERHYGREDAPTERGVYLRSTVPAGRMAAASEIAAAVLFLASDEASFVTGEALTVDGGQSIHTGPVWRSFEHP